MLGVSREDTTRDVFTIFATPKPFVGHTAVIQTNALRSWTVLSSRPDVIVFGDEEGTGSVCEELGIRHEKYIDRNEFGTPMVNDLFARAHQLARTEILCYANSDIILLDDLARAIKMTLRWAGRRPFLMFGRRWDLPVARLLAEEEFQPELSRRARSEGEASGDLFLDYFVFMRSQYRSVPSFAVGRACWDNWVVFEARKRGFSIIDASEEVTAIHQQHDHRHMLEGETAWLDGVEAQRNRELLRSLQGGRSLFGLSDATHFLAGPLVRQAWRRKGLRDWARHEANRMAFFHPRLKPYLGAAVRAKARLMGRSESGPPGASSRGTHRP